MLAVVQNKNHTKLINLLISKVSMCKETPIENPWTKLYNVQVGKTNI